MDWLEFRQRRYPVEFRIGAPRWHEGLTRALEALASVPDGAPAPAPAGPSPESVRFLADVATGLWRLRERMRQPGTDRPLDEMRRAYRHLESTWDALSQAGVKIIDHTGEAFHFGRELKAIYQPTPGLHREKVLETIKPTVYFRDAPIQMGEVIVGTPGPAVGGDRSPTQS